MRWIFSEPFWKIRFWGICHNEISKAVIEYKIRWIICELVKLNILYKLYQILSKFFKFINWKLKLNFWRAFWKFNVLTNFMNGFSLTGRLEWLAAGLIPRTFSLLSFVSEWLILGVYFVLAPKVKDYTVWLLSELEKD